MTANPLEKEGFRQLLAAAADAMMVVDANEKVVALNPAAERLLGWTEAELLGAPLERIIPPRFQQLIRGQFVVHGEEAGTPERRAPVGMFARRRDGPEFPVEIAISSLDPGQDTLSLVTIRDLTRWRGVQETLFQEKERAFGTLASIADAVITTDLAGLITYLNPTAERLTGWRTTEALGRPLDVILSLISESTRQPIENITVRCLREGRAVDLLDGVLMLRRDGTEMAIGEDSCARLARLRQRSWRRRVRRRPGARSRLRPG